MENLKRAYTLHNNIKMPIVTIISCVSLQSILQSIFLLNLDYF
jgi:hypothetical protein